MTILIGFLSIFVGALIGATPFLRDLVHIYAWSTIPISCLVFGAVIGSLQFVACFQVSLLGNKLRAAFFAVCAVLAFIAADIGTYATVSVPVRGNAHIADGEYKLRSLISLREYVQFYFSRSERHSRRLGNFKVSALENKIGYIIEIVEVAVCAPLVLLGRWKKFRVCVPCGTYPRRRRSWKIRPSSRDETNRVLGKFNEAIRQPGLQALTDTLSAETACSQKSSTYHIHAEERSCPVCKATSIHGVVRYLDGKKLVELPEAAFEKHGGDAQSVGFALPQT